MAFLKLTLVTFGLLYAVALSGMYAFQREQREARIVFRGDRAAVTDWLRAHTAQRG